MQLLIFPFSVLELDIVLGHGRSETVQMLPKYNPRNSSLPHCMDSITSRSLLAGPFEGQTATALDILERIPINRGPLLRSDQRLRTGHCRQAIRWTVYLLRPLYPAN